MPVVPGNLIRSGPHQVTALFVIHNQQATFTGSVNGDAPLQFFTTNDVTLTYNEDSELGPDRTFEGPFGMHDFELTLDNGAVIKGKLNGHGINSTSTISGSGSWALS
ncbi:hypothetical protein F4810DRAFT_45606 [Camillea tinctor]|nr:hypothetical protein F4810DRAFT_45606 [Camillea tinctor]